MEDLRQGIIKNEGHQGKEVHLAKTEIAVVAFYDCLDIDNFSYRREDPPLEAKERHCGREDCFDDALELLAEDVARGVQDIREVSSTIDDRYEELTGAEKRKFLEYFNKLRR